MALQDYVLKKYGDKDGKNINDHQKTNYDLIVLKIENKSENQIRTLKDTILPHVALYKALQELNYSQDDALLAVKEYLDNYVGKGMNETLKRMEIIPGFFTIFRKIMYKIVYGNDNWDSEILENSKNKIAYTVKKCLWFEACKENDCIELCKVFCDTDHIIYGNLKKVAFTRKGTIGNGSEYCDFCYSKKVRSRI